MKYIQLLNKKEEINNIVNQSQSNEKTETIDIKYYEGFKKGVLESFNLFNSTIDFYKQYKDNVKLLMKEQNKLWHKWVEYYNTKTGIDKSNYNDNYNIWLFENLFSELNNNESNETMRLY
jgi:hypothetical protein